jgi:hypothetical protein
VQLKALSVTQVIDCLKCLRSSKASLIMCSHLSGNLDFRNARYVPRGPKNSLGFCNYGIYAAVLYREDEIGVLLLEQKPR